jgi:hypothetical protein
LAKRATVAAAAAAGWNTLRTAPWQGPDWPRLAVCVYLQFIHAQAMQEVQHSLNLLQARHFITLQDGHTFNAPHNSH